MGDVQTGDGIQRIPEKPGEQSLLAPLGGEGGSVLQALGSKAEERAKRRKKKKDSYAEYLESSTWRNIRARALKRDQHKCRACGDPAIHVHHVRYPKNLGQEKMEWLYSLCAPCHNAIHRAATTMTLRKATDLILGAEKNGKIVRLPDDWRLSQSAARQRAFHRRTPLKPRKAKKIKGHKTRERKRIKLEKQNDELHQFFKANREYRERSRGVV